MRKLRWGNKGRGRQLEGGTDKAVVELEQEDRCGVKSEGCAGSTGISRWGPGRGERHLPGGEATLTLELKAELC